MTRREFIDTVDNFSDLKFFCDDNRIDICDYIIDRDYYDEIILESVRDHNRFESWQELYRFLQDLPDDTDYYIENDYGEFSGATDDDFAEYKQEVLDYMDEHGEWDPEESDEDEPEDEDYIVQTESEEDVESDEYEIPDEEFFIMIRKAG